MALVMVNVWLALFILQQQQRTQQSQMIRMQEEIKRQQLENKEQKRSQGNMSIVRKREY